MKSPHRILCVFPVIVCTAFAQNIGDYRSLTVGDWHATATWRTWNGTTWVTPDSVPGAGSSAYIDSAVTLTQEESCNDLHIWAVTQTRLTTSAHALHVHGRLRAYTGSAPGSSTSSPPATTTWINTSGGGRIVIAGDSRAVTTPGEWGANPPGWTVQVTMNNGQTATMNTNFKAGDILVTSGTLSLPSGDLRADRSSPGTGTITINAGATLSLGSGKLTRTGTASTGYFGALTVNGKLAFTTSAVGSINANSIAFNGTVEYCANAAQTLVERTSGGGGSATPDTYTDLFITESGVKTLSLATIVKGSLGFSGTASLGLGTNDLTILGSIAGAGETSMVITNNSGSLRQVLAAGRTVTFPVGANGSDFNPLSVTLGPADIADTFAVRVRPDVTPPAPNNQCVVQSTWTITEGTAGGSNAALSFQWNALQEGTSFNRSAAGIWRYDGSGWIESSPGQLAGSGPYTITSIASIRSFGPIIVGNDGALPISLSDFSAYVLSDQSVQLAWATISEVNNYGFEVQRSGKTTGGFRTISGLIPGNGTTQVHHQYSYADLARPSHPVYYRLRQIDLDGTVRITPTIAPDGRDRVDPWSEGSMLLQNQPNPFNQTTIIGIRLHSAANVSLKVHDLLGREAKTLMDGPKPAGTYRLIFDASDMASGVYFYRFLSRPVDGGLEGTHIETRRMILLR